MPAAETTKTTKSHKAKPSSSDLMDIIRSQGLRGLTSALAHSKEISQKALDMGLACASQSGPARFYIASMSAKDSVACMLALEDRGAKVTARSLHGAADYGCPAPLKELFAMAKRQGFDPNPITSEGRTPLFTTAMSPGPDASLARIFLDAGANLNHRDVHGWSPLHGAAYKGNWEFFHELVALGANPNLMEEGGHDPLRYAQWENGMEDAEMAGHLARIASTQEKARLDAAVKPPSKPKARKASL